MHHGHFSPGHSNCVTRSLCNGQRVVREKGANAWRKGESTPRQFTVHTVSKLQVCSSAYFFIFTIIKNDFCIFIRLIWLGVGFLNMTGAEIGYNLIKMQKNNFLLLHKFKNTESAQLWFHSFWRLYGDNLADWGCKICLLAVRFFSKSFTSG